MPNLGAPELIIIALVILLLFGATRLPKLGKSMGQSIKGFKEGLNEDSERRRHRGRQEGRHGRVQGRRRQGLLSVTNEITHDGPPLAGRRR